MTAGSNRKPEDPLKGASEVFEKHESDLLKEAMARIQRDIPEGATVGEALREMQRAMLEDADARELLLRVAVLQNQSSGHIRTYFEETSAKASDLDAKYVAANRGRPLSKEELDLMVRLGEEIDRRLPPDFPEAEREARVLQLLQEDEELAKLVARLERLEECGGTLPPHERTDDDEA